MVRRLLIPAVLAAGIGLSACGSAGDGTVARHWLPKLEEENAITCRKDDCGDDVVARQAALTEELAADARDAGGAYEPVAALADRVRLAALHWEADCYPDGSYSRSAGMSCDEAFDLHLYGTEELGDLIRGIAREEEAAR